MVVELHNPDQNGDLLIQLFRRPKIPSNLLQRRGSTLSVNQLSDLARMTDKILETWDNIGNRSPDGGPTRKYSNALKEVQVRASSKHLKLASPVFAAMLGNGTFQEGHTLDEEGCVEIGFPDDDPEAFIILLNICHCRSRLVPREVTFECLVEIAILVDKYDMLGMVKFYSDTWIANLVMKEHNAKPLSWLFLFWVFEMEDNFKDMSRTVLEGCDENLEAGLDPRLSIPSSVIDKIKASRMTGIHSILDNVYKLIPKYTMKAPVCTNGVVEQRFACDSIALGSLLKRSFEIGIWPILEEPYPGKSLEELASQIREMKFLSGCNHTGGDSSHSLKAFVDIRLGFQESFSTGGLELWDHKKRG